MVIVGDTNELGSRGLTPPGTKSCPPYPGSPGGYELVFPDFGPLKVSQIEGKSCSRANKETNGTCCSNSHWQYFFDRVVVNHWAADPVASVIDTAAYPLFNGSEEHKAIYGVVSFPAPQ